jgi:hypothetical protein
MTSPGAMIAGGRALAESQMQDTSTIKRASDETTIDPSTGLPTTTWTTIYSGKCKIQSDSVQAVNPTSGDHSYTVDRLSVHVPVSATGVQVGDQVEITDSALDAANMGRKFRVASMFRKTFATAQRLPVEEVVA